MSAVSIDSHREDASLFASSLSNAPSALRARFLAFLRLAVILSTAVSVSSSHAFTDPATIGTTTPIEKINDIKNQPLALLAKFPDAGNAMAQYVSKLLNRDPSIVDSILSIMGDTSPAQAAAIGAGFVRGVRAMSVNRVKTAQLVSAKIMKSNNQWMKTTFHALGPNYSATAPLILPPILETAGLSDVPVGDALPADESRLGPEPIYDPKMNAFVGNRDESLEGQGEINLNDSGTMIAILLSDAPHNGAVSTSPTN